MSSPNHIKIGMFGSGNCGKTSITLRFMKGDFSEGYIPTIDDEFSKVLSIDGQTVSLSVVDTAGNDDWTEMRYSYYKKVNGFVFVIDIGNPQSIEDIKSMYHDAQKSRDDDIICAIAANNCHYRDENKKNLISPEEYKSLEKEFNCKVFETSVKTGKNINELFEYVAKRILNPKIDQKPRLSFNNKPPQQLKPQNCDLTTRRSSLFSKLSKDKKKSRDISAIQPPPQADSTSNKLIEDLKSFALAKANQLKTSLQTNKQLEEKVCNLEQQLEQYDQKIKELEKQLKEKSEKIEELEYQKNILGNNLNVINSDELKEFEAQGLIGKGSYSKVEKISRKQDLVLKSYYIDLFQNIDSIGTDNENKEINSNILIEIKKQYEIVNGINNPNIAKALGIFFGDDSNPPSIILEYYPYNLQKVIKELTDIERISIISEICNAMKDVHTFQLVHCDLNPGNILLDSNKHVKLSDFGMIAFMQSDTPIIGRTQVYETQTFMAPELLLCENEFNQKVDVYSFGVIVFYILTKGKKINAKNSTEDGIVIPKNKKINEFSCNLINKCCSKLANERPSFAEIAEDIKQNRFELINGVDTSSLY